MYCFFFQIQILPLRLIALSLTQSPLFFLTINMHELSIFIIRTILIEIFYVFSSFIAFDSMKSSILLMHTYTVYGVSHRLSSQYLPFQLKSQKKIDKYVIFDLFVLEWVKQQTRGREIFPFTRFIYFVSDCTGWWWWNDSFPWVMVIYGLSFSMNLMVDAYRLCRWNVHIHSHSGCVDMKITVVPICADQRYQITILIK